MSLANISIVCLFSFIIGMLSVSAGGTSLITVPMLISLGMSSKNAIATNMFALIFLSISGAIGFRREIKPIYYKTVVILSILTICGSLIGATLILIINKEILKKIIGIVICIIASFSLFNKDLGTWERKVKISRAKFTSVALLIFILGIYGGFFSGGYIIFLTYVFILIYGLDFLQVAFITKILNVFSSLAACIFFYYYDLIDFIVGIPLAFSMCLGAFLGAKLAVAKGNLWVRNLFVITAIGLAVKLLFF